MSPDSSDNVFDHFGEFTEIVPVDPATKGVEFDTFKNEEGSELPTICS